MFNYTILTDTERIEDIYTYFDVEFSDGENTYIEEYRITNDAKEMEIENLKQTQFLFKIERLEQEKIIK